MKQLTDVKLLNRVSVRLGSDFELFYRDKKTGDVIPADNLLPDEEHGLSTADFKLKKAVYYDGIQAECRTDPESCIAYVMDDFVRLFRTMQSVADIHDATLSLEPSVSITPDILNRVKDPLSRRFGCSPHRSERMMGDIEVIRVNGEEWMTRYAGFHIHFGGTGKTLSTANGHLRFIRMLDLVLGNTMVMFEGNADRLRREVYGKAGTFRDKSYGIEYRPLSNIIGISPMLTDLAFTLGRVAFYICENELDEYFAVDPDAVRHAIDNVDKGQAWKNWNEIRNNLSKISNARNPFAFHIYRKEHSTALKMYEFLALGGKDLFDETFTKNFHTAWGLDRPELHPNHGSCSASFEEGTTRLTNNPSWAGREEWEKFESKWNSDQQFALNA